METNDHNKVILINGEAERRRNRRRRKGLGILSCNSDEDYDHEVKGMILDPTLPILNKWNRVFLVASLVSLFVDPIFFFLPVVNAEDGCIQMSAELGVALTVVRSMADVFYVAHILIRFRTAYVAPSSRIFGRGDLVIHPSKIAANYLGCEFWLHFAAALPLPQAFIWIAIPKMRGWSCIVRLGILFQYMLRLYLIFPLSDQIIKATGVLMKTAWVGAVYNLMLFMLASHVLGSCWYLLSIGRQMECWKKVCNLGHYLGCEYEHFYCKAAQQRDHPAWWFQIKATNISNLCNPSATSFFNFGIFSDSFASTSSPFITRYLYCFWWGLRNLSSLGQNLLTSSNVGEINFAIVIAILGLVLFALLIGNMQTYLQSTTLRLEEWRRRRRDTEQWMQHRQLPNQLKQCVRNYEQFRWIATHGVDEQQILKSLPLDLRRHIKRHLCLDLLRQVPLLDEMEETMLDAICERLNPYLITSNTYLIREGDPVNEMLFIIRGYLDSHTTNGGRTGFFNSSRLGPSDFCGEELLPWALVDDPRAAAVFPSSTRTVKAVTEVEGFALVAEDLKFVAAQFRKLHSKQIRSTFRFYSHQWRTWAACFIQAAWFRYKRRMKKEEEDEINVARKMNVVHHRSLVKPLQLDFSVEHR
ncbi:putative cyclic nucleotide-gated ion channel 15 [Cucumis melo var. makuwa]|uniref:Cyclic nucleotide-gated ion channel 15 n=2 Tax=Cucumis melo TaxID=3656 RepID=A0A5A7U1A0_CUCMM|nr:protein CNGC15b-like [Cucumis melo]KAA0047259.1 putative cyclic nucleotide-gated ion channel 15 [Cucumis melo var. makuwa]